MKLKIAESCVLGDSSLDVVPPLDLGAEKPNAFGLSHNLKHAQNAGEQQSRRAA